jgi:predicted metal-dependent hydrolase
MKKVEIRTVSGQNGALEYQLTRKDVKNINIRVKPNGCILVSANTKVPIAYIDDLIRQREGFIVRARENYAKNKTNMVPIDREVHRKQLMKKYPKEYQLQFFGQICDEVQADFERSGYRVPFKELRIRYMTARWGSCQPRMGIITLNSCLMEKPRRAVEYVVLHEFAHFVHPNHSKDFYALVERLMPDWKQRKALLNS